MFVSKEKFYGEYGKALNVSESKRTCDFKPASDAATRTGVRLQALVDEKNGFAVIPKEGSDIAVVFVNKNKAFVANTSSVEKIVYQGGKNGGLINIDDIVTKLNNLEDDNNNLKTALSLWVPVTQDGGAALKAGLATYYAQRLIPTRKIELEDDKFTH
jgi:hypothetical protein